MRCRMRRLIGGIHFVQLKRITKTLANNIKLYTCEGVKMDPQVLKGARIQKAIMKSCNCVQVYICAAHHRLWWAAHNATYVQLNIITDIIERQLWHSVELHFSVTSMNYLSAFFFHLYCTICFAFSFIYLKAIHITYAVLWLCITAFNRLWVKLKLLPLDPPIL